MNTAQLVLELQLQKKNSLYLQIFPKYTWKKIGTNIFFLKGTHFLVAVDYFSRYIEVVQLENTSRNITEGLKSMFSRHGIPETVVSDNGPQYSSCEFSTFAMAYILFHTTSSPYYSQNNGQAECAVQIAKQLLTKSEDPYLALLTYHATPIPCCKVSPSELLMGRHLRTTLPQVEEHLQPTLMNLESNTLVTNRNRSQLMMTVITYAPLLQFQMIIKCGLPLAKQKYLVE